MWIRKGAQELLEHLCSMCVHVRAGANGIFALGAIVTEVSSERC